MQVRVALQSIGRAALILGTATFFVGLGAFVWRSTAPPLQAWLLVSSVAALVLLGIVLYQFATIRTRAKTLALQMSEENRLFVELYDRSPVPYLRVTARGRVRDVNAAAARLFGVTRSTLQAWDIFSRLHSTDESRASEIREFLSRGVAISEREAMVTVGDGTTRYVLLSAFPYKGSREALLTLFDITKQKHVDIAKTEFVSLASHQLNTPISSMKWNLELLGTEQVGALNDAQRKFVAKLTRNVDRMDTVVQDFLDASQLEMGSFATEPTAIELTQFLQELLEQFDARVAEKELTVDFLVPQPPLTITADAHLLRMAVNNLVSNAVKYTRPGGTITVRYEAVDGGVAISVTDTGFGIPKNEQTRLFSKFFRAQNARASAEQGTGLGLYITHKAVTLNGGTITVDSTEDVGSTFTVILPSGSG